MPRPTTAVTAAIAAAGGLLLGQVLPLSAAGATSEPSGPPAATVAPTASGTADPSATPTASATASPGGGDGRVEVPADRTEQTPVLTLEAAQQLAAAALESCQGRGFEVTVSVVDRDGVEIVTIRDEDATGATVAVATGKAFAAVGFRSPTRALQEAARTSPGFATVPGFVILPGGQPISAGQDLVGGIGVSGAPTGEIDDECIDDAEAATSAPSDVS